MRITLALLVLLVVPMRAHSQAGAWAPKIEFELEDASYKETLVWVSGYSYALTEVGRKGGIGANICLLANGVVDSKVLVEALNVRFKGQRITSEQAAPELYAAAAQTYRCAK